jgi:DNA-binding NtrC family response regulator
VITPNESTTFVPRHEASDDPVKVPLILVVGDNRGNVPQGADRIVAFTGSLVVGRREATQGEPGQSSLALPDRMISAQHMAITPAPDDGVYELTDLSSTNGTVVDGEPVETTVRLRDGSVIFVGSHVLVFRVTTVAQRTAIEAELSNPLGPVATANPTFATVCQKLRKLAAAGEELLLTGETGVGKEVYAEAIHRASGRTGRFVAINCAAIPRELVETELFGYARGAHSQAAMAKGGIIEEAENGTLFLDEIGEMLPASQSKLLKVLEDHRIRPVGSARDREVDVRFVAATNVPLEERVRSGEFREDLLYRLRTIRLAVPPLRERGEDAMLLAEHFLADHRRRYGRSELHLEACALEAIRRHSWPGNVRELRNVLEQAALLSVGVGITADDLSLWEPPPLRDQNGGGDPGGATLVDVERDLIVRALQQAGGNVTVAAQALGITRDTLRYRMDKHQLRRNAFT